MDKIFFSDLRFDQYYKEIYELFEVPIEGFYVPPKNIEEWNTGKPLEVSKLQDELRRKVDDCRHKAAAARYSLALIENEIKNGPSAEDLEQYSEMIRNKMFPKAEIMNEVLINETESFIFQVRGNLDIIVQLLKHLYVYLEDKKVPGKDRESFKSDRRKGKTTADLMRDNGCLDMADYFDKQIDDWIQNLNELRNDVTHRSGLSGFSCYTYESGEGKVISPQMPDGSDLNDYCHNIYKKLLDLYKHIFDNFVVPEIKRRSKEPYL